MVEMSLLIVLFLFSYDAFLELEHGIHCRLDAADLCLISYLPSIPGVLKSQQYLGLPSVQLFPCP